MGIIKQFGIEFKEEDLKQLAFDGKYVLKFRTVYRAHYSKNAGARLEKVYYYRGSLPLTKPDRFHIMDFESVNELLGFKLLIEGARRMKTKEQLKKEMEAEFEHKAAMLDIECQVNGLPGFKHLLEPHDGVCAVFAVDTIADISTVLDGMPTTEKSFLQKHGSNEHAVHSPYKINTKPQVRGPVEASIQYKSEPCNVWVQFKAELIGDHVLNGFRGVTDCEYHYFGGVSRNELEKISIPKADFKGKSLAYFGGNYTLIDEKAIAAIIDSLRENLTTKELEQSK